jgi:phosphopentomutase
LKPPRSTLLDHLQSAGIETVGIGKIDDLFAGQGLSTAIHTASNAEGMDRTLGALDEHPEGMIFVNLVETDMVWGHRNDPRGFAGALEQFDARLGDMLSRLTPADALFISADHGCDPTTPSTDHSREVVPILCYGPGLGRGVNLGRRQTYADLAATLAGIHGVTPTGGGESFLPLISIDRV